MLPQSVKQGRWLIFRDIIYTFSRIIIKEALQQGLAIRYKKETNRAVGTLSEFMKWVNRDTHAVRRRSFRLERKRARANRAKKSAVFRGIKEVPPVAFIELFLESLEEEPAGMIRHHDGLRTEGHTKFPHPKHGVDWFLQNAAKNKVVMRFIDARNSNQGLVLADFTKCDWEGWILDGEPDEEDCLYRPETAKQRVDIPDTNWLDVRFVMKASAKAARRTRTSVGGRGGGNDADDEIKENRIVQMGSVLDLQGCRTFTALNKKGKPLDPTSLVRINLGLFPFKHDQLKERHGSKGLARLSKGVGAGVETLKDLQGLRNHEIKQIVKAHNTEKVEVRDGVLEVIGYMGTLRDPAEKSDMLFNVPEEGDEDADERNAF